MTIHRDMFNNGIAEPEGDTLHRVYVEFEGGYWIEAWGTVITVLIAWLLLSTRFSAGLRVTLAI